MDGKDAGTGAAVVLESVQRSTHPAKKWTALFRVGKKSKEMRTSKSKDGSHGGTKKRVHFGARGMSDYTLHGNKARRAAYRRRHAKDLVTGDPTRAGYLSYFLLWGKPTMEASVRDYRRRLRVHARTGRFPTHD